MNLTLSLNHSDLGKPASVLGSRKRLVRLFYLEWKEVDYEDAVGFHSRNQENESVRCHIISEFVMLQGLLIRVQGTG
jgi:hypothetical protein